MKTKKKRKPVNTAEKLRATQWKPGQSGNPAGRPKGSRNKLGEAFIQDVYAQWLEGGEAALLKMRRNDPGGFVRVVAGILPKELNIKDDTLAHLSDDEISETLQTIRALRVGRGRNGASNGSAAPSGKAEPGSVH